MLGYEDQVKEYITVNFQPSNPDQANFRRTTEGLLAFLWSTFPENCINDYELNEILIELGYERFNYLVEQADISETGKGRNKTEVTTIRKSLVSGWCLKSPFDMREDTFAVPI